VISKRRQLGVQETRNKQTMRGSESERKTRKGSEDWRNVSKVNKMTDDVNKCEQKQRNRELTVMPGERIHYRDRKEGRTGKTSYEMKEELIGIV
jgi:hypothetical protein